MTKKLFMRSPYNNDFKAVDQIEDLSEEKALDMLNSIKKQAIQLKDIKQFYDELQYFKKLNFEINLLINDIKNDFTKIYEITHLSRLLARYCYAFRDFVTFSQKYVVKHDSGNLEKLLINSQFDTYYEYRLAYSLGNYVKHISQFVPISDRFDEHNYDFFIRIDTISKTYANASGKDKETLQARIDIDLLTFLDVTMECVFVQAKSIIKQIFFNDKADEYFKITHKLIRKYGTPFYLDANNYQFLNDNILYLGIETSKIINKLGIANIKFV